MKFNCVLSIVGVVTTEPRYQVSLTKYTFAENKNVKKVKCQINIKLNHYHVQ